MNMLIGNAWAPIEVEAVTTDEIVALFGRTTPVEEFGEGEKEGVEETSEKR